jgi:hypothetical protein
MNTVARNINVILGFWLFLSAFMWPHGHSEFVNTVILGLVTMFVALIAFGVPTLRFLNTAVGVWLILSWFVLSRSSGATAWNNILAGVAIVGVSLLGDGVTRRPVGQTPHR